MANTNAPFGFRLLTLASEGVAGTGGLIRRKCAAAGSSIYQGDALKELGTGYLGPLTASAGLCPVGILEGVEYIDVNGRKIYANYYTANTAAAGSEVILKLIPCTPGSLFTVQTRSTNLTIADVGATIDIYAGSGSATGGYGKSGMVVDQGTLGTVATLPFTVKGLFSDYAAPNENGIDNTSNYNIVVVAPNFGNMVGV
jgi:hypothetical protein